MGGVNGAVPDSRPFGEGERGSELGRQPKHRVERQRSLRQALGQIATRQPSIDEVGRARLPPPVEQQRDVGVFEAADALRLGLEATDEVGGVGERRPQLADGDDVPKRRMDALPQGRRLVLADGLEQPVGP